jgi:nucleotidyltransferase/DNA polymerase involved in DNA repair
MSAMLGAMPGAVTEAVEAVTNKNPPIRRAASQARTAEFTEAGGLQGLVTQLRGVPKGALKAILGKELGARIWRQSRGKTAAEDEAVRDGEVVAELIGHLSRQAAEELRKNERQAKFVRLTVWYQDGSSASERVRLAGLTQDAAEIQEAAVRLFRGFERPAGQVNSVNLDVTAAAAGATDGSAASRLPGWLAMPVGTAAG